MKKINILKKRREDFNLKSDFEIIPTNNLLIKGGIYGLINIFSIILFFFLLIIYNQRLLSKKDNLKPYASKYDSIQKDLNKNNNLFNKNNETNKILIEAISGIRSGSGLFLEISKVTPKLIELNELEVGKSGVKIVGISPQKFGLKVINSYQLSLSKSPFFNEQNIKIIKASKFSRTDYSEIEKKDIKNDYLKFEILANFNELNNSVSSEYLDELGSYGLANRLNIIDEIRKKWLIFNPKLLKNLSFWLEKN